MTASKTRGYLAGLAKRLLWNAQGGKCHICGQGLPRRFRSPLLTLDHVWPKSGSATMLCKYEGNVLLAHAKCNGLKGDRKPTGCERLMLFVVNRRLGYREHETQMWDRLNG